MVSDHGAYTLRTSARLNQSFRRPQFDARDERRRLDAQDGVAERDPIAAASASSSGVHPPSGPIAISRSPRSRTVGRPARPPTPLGKHVGRRNRTDRSRGARPAATASAPRPRPGAGGSRWRCRPVAVPAHDRAFGVQEHDPVDARARSAFWTSHSGRSCFGIATAIVDGTWSRSTTTTSPIARDGAPSAMWQLRHRPWPSVTVTGSPLADPQHAEHVMARRRRRAPATSTSATRT